MRTDGIHTLDDLRARCWIDDDTGCWNWRGAASTGNPAVWLPGLRSHTSLGVAICWLTTGARPRKGNVWHVACGNKLCANPEHRNRRGTRSTQMLAAGLVRTPLVCARIAARKRASSRYSEAVVDAVRNSGGTLKATAERYGCSISFVSMVRRGEIRAPLAAPGSSVFAMRGTA